MNFQTRSFVMPSGERYCLLFEKTSAIPLFYPNLFVTTQVRNNSKSLSAMESALSGVKVLLTFCEEREINLSERFLKRHYFTLGELDGIRDHCQDHHGKTRTNSVHQLRSISSTKTKKKTARKTGLASEYMRLTYIAKYVEWLATILREAGPPDHVTTQAIARMKDGLESRRPSGKGRNQVGREKGLTKEQEVALMDIVLPGSERNLTATAPRDPQR